MLVEMILPFYSSGVVPAIVWIRWIKTVSYLCSSSAATWATFFNVLPVIKNASKHTPQTRASPCLLLCPIFLIWNMIVPGLLTSCPLTYIWNNLLFFEANDCKAKNASTKFLGSFLTFPPHLLKDFTWNYFPFQKLKSFKADDKLPLQINHTAPIIF